MHGNIMKDTLFIWKPLIDFIFHIDESKKHGFERRILIFTIIVASVSIIHVWIEL